MDDPRENPKKKKEKKSKKARKDKWGQPVLSEAATMEEEEQALEEQQQESGHRGSGLGDALPGPYEPNKVVVSGMPYTTTEDEIRDLFKGIGPVAQLELSRFPDSGNFRGLAFVSFQTEAVATSSLKLDGTKMGNRFVKVERCRMDTQRKRKSEFLTEPEKVDGCLSAYIGNLSWEVTEDDIRDCFEASKIVSVRFAGNRKTGRSRFCHRDFEDDESLENAIKKNQAELHGRPMKIAYAVCNRS